jgi:NADPH:quinone reductase-like Zn-dependent oxidoreductase
VKAYVLSRFGRDGLVRAERPAPDPGPREVLVRILASSLNHRDLLVASGAYDPDLLLPLVPLSDGAGEVVAVGEDVTRFALGDRVVTTVSQTWLGGPLNASALASTLGGPLHGTLAHEIAVHEDGLVLVPDHLSFEEAATLPCAAVTAWNALVEQSELAAGETLLVLGTGGVATFALQFAVLLGARVIVVSGTEEKLERAKQLGAWATVYAKATPGWDQWVRELTDGAGVDHVLEVGGAGTLDRSVSVTRPNGHVSLIGVLGGSVGPINLAPILSNNIRVQGVFVGSRTTFEAMNRSIIHHHLTPVIDRSFAFDEAHLAYRYMERRLHVGKIVVRGDA